MWIEPDRTTIRTENTAAPEDPHRFPSILTAGEAARLLRVSPDTIYRWSSQGLLKGVASRGQPLRLKRDQLIEWFFDRRGKRPARRSIRKR